jgi:hypothetical protein
MLSVPSAATVLQQVAPAFEAYGNGDQEAAWAIFLSAATGLDWTGLDWTGLDNLPRPPREEDPRRGGAGHQGCRHPLRG